MAIKFDLKTVTDISVVVGTGISLYYLLNRLLGDIESGPLSGRSKESRLKQSTQWQKLVAQRPELARVELNPYEKTILSSVVCAEDIDVSFDDIGGLDNIISGLHESVVYPLMLPELYGNGQNPLMQAPSGVLLHGPPGCGKTMLAKALAKESGANFISIRMSSIMDKWYGESNKIVDAIFSLANKIEPCMIFIDEIDSFLRERASMDHEVTATVKAEFMTLWDGLLSNGRILIVGATNRMQDIDSAFLRRLPKKFYISLPGEPERVKILKKLLKETELDKRYFEIETIAKLTRGYSGSDLKETCREAVLNAAKEYIDTRKKALLQENKTRRRNEAEEDDTNKIRPLRTEDFTSVMKLSAQQPVSTVPLD